ncbi:carbamoyl-phosphate synthase domain-containing protein [Xylocopilactobacillus apicola]|uniref:Carbamoyl phosphate synthase small subunit n=1 Tax=Xylocopilactobacillus apicola TaxID=2932184 RepID=A0AAU9D542_9LACO|nr:carbamoyl-phosphate synthase domain-containing protein [Xylocopilactobacillus apicola]BDR58603.1 carbamoyl phosphate synthase small subunit [Xylocopilactobacillus apicola]
MKKYLILNDGSTFEGESFGSDAIATGRLVFHLVNHSVTESLTAPNNYGAIVVSSDPAVGLREIDTMDLQSLETNIKGFIVSNFLAIDRPEGIQLDRYLKEKNIPGLYNLNVHKLIEHLQGVKEMDATIIDYVDQHAFDQLRAFVNPNNLTDFVSNKGPYLIPGSKKTVVVLNLGLKTSLYRSLVEVGLNCIVLPYDASLEMIDSYHPAGIIITDGPGNTNELSALVDKIPQLAEHYSILGIGLGQSLIAQAFKIRSTEKNKIACYEGQYVVERSTGEVSQVHDDSNYLIPYEEKIKRIAFVLFTDVKRCFVKAFRIRKHNIIGISFDLEYAGSGRNYLLDEFVDNLS